MRNRSSASVIVLVFICAVCLSPKDADSQTWERRLLGQGVPSDMHFYDRDNGIVIVGKGGYRFDVYHTTDGGDTWQFQGNRSGLERTKDQQLSALSPGAYVSLGVHLSMSLDSGRTWATKWLPSEALAGRMFSPTFGYLLLGNKDVAIRVTRDTGNFWIEWAGVD
jgi:photosystem II stability/assembly factor-like uncharacterized protein